MTVALVQIRLLWSPASHTLQLDDLYGVLCRELDRRWTGPRRRQPRVSKTWCLEEATVLEPTLITQAPFRVCRYRCHSRGLARGVVLRVPSTTHARTLGL